MNITGIIAEYNPLTYGHVYHINVSKAETGADAVAVCMSGNFVQRGEPAIMEKYIRAETAIKAGADFVLELPTAYAVSPADVFALGALKTLSLVPSLNTISFGSECGNIDALTKTAEILLDEPEEYKSQLKQALQNKMSFVKAQSIAFDSYVKINGLDYLIGILNEPNNVLGISYIKTALLLNLNLKFHTVKRIGNYNDQSVSVKYPSASSIRASFLDGKINELQDIMPEYTLDALKTAKKSVYDKFSTVALYRFRSLKSLELLEYYDFTEGLNNRFKSCSEKAADLNELLNLVKSKRYTLARLKRLALYPVLEITEKLIDNAKVALPPLRVLAIKKERTDLLKLISSSENLVTKYKDFEKLPFDAQELNALDINASKIYALFNESTDFNTSMLLI